MPDDGSVRLLNNYRPRGDHTMRKRVSKQDEEAWDAFHNAVVADAIAEFDANPMFQSLFDSMYGDLKNLPEDEAAVFNAEEDYYTAAKKVRALQAEKRRNKQPQTFEQRVSEEDAILARGMGIRLD
jgi:hypothetical protein